jgi:hypothetical protein
MLLDVPPDAMKSRRVIDASRDIDTWTSQESVIVLASAISQMRSRFEFRSKFRAPA